MEQRDYSAFEFGATTDIDGGRGECFPDYRLTDIGCDEEIDTRAETISFLEQFIEKDNNESCNNELDD